MSRVAYGYCTKRLNHSYFKNIDDPNVLYWLGFITADGCIWKNNLKISLAEKDKHHLEKFQKDINSKHKLNKNISKCSKRNSLWNDSICYHLSIFSKTIIQDLSKYSILPNKTENSIFPDIIINNKFLSHYYRGYFDGDGCASIAKSYNNKKPYLCISFRGTEEFLSNFNKILVEKQIISTKFKNKKLGDLKSISKNLRYNGNRVSLDIANWLYSNMNKNSLFLKRKFDIVCQAKSLI